MFITSKRNLLVKFPDGSEYKIARDFVGEIPDELAEVDLIKLAISDGTIVTPKSKEDEVIEAAVEEAAELENDIRPDAEKKDVKKDK